MKNITLTIGLSGSGKSTYAKEQVSKNKNIVLINRDLIRETIAGNLDGYYERSDLSKLEDIVSHIEDELFIMYCGYDYSMIVHNCHLKQKYIKRWMELAKYYKYNVYFKIFNVDAQVCKERVMERDFAGRTTPQLVDYIDIQDKQFHSIVEWINKNYKDKIIE